MSVVFFLDGPPAGLGLIVKFSGRSRLGVCSSPDSSVRGGRNNMPSVVSFVTSSPVVVWVIDMGVTVYVGQPGWV